MKATFVIFAAALACAVALPAENAQDKLKENVKEAFAPVAKEVRMLLDNSEKVADAIGQKAVVAGERLMETAKTLFETAQKSDRANLESNLKDRMLGAQDEVKANVRAVFEEAKAEAAPLQANVRSILSGSRSAMEFLSERYLTPDGKALVRSLISMAGMLN